MGEAAIRSSRNKAAPLSRSAKSCRPSTRRRSVGSTGLDLAVSVVSTCAPSRATAVQLRAIRAWRLCGPVQSRQCQLPEPQHLLARGTGFRVTLFREPGMSGGFEHFESDAPNLGGIDNAARSMRVERKGSNACSVGANGIALYRDPNWVSGGGCLFVTGDVPDLSSQSLPNGTLDAADQLGAVLRQLLSDKAGNPVPTTQLSGRMRRLLAGLHVPDLVLRSGDVRAGRRLHPTAACPHPAGTYFAGNIAQAAYLYPDSAAPAGWKPGATSGWEASGPMTGCST